MFDRTKFPHTYPKSHLAKFDETTSYLERMRFSKGHRKLFAAILHLRWAKKKHVRQKLAQLNKDETIRLIPDVPYTKFWFNRSSIRYLSTKTG